MIFTFGYVHDHWIWVALTILFAVIEAFTLGLTTIWFAIGALVLVFLSFLPIPMVFQVLIFLAISSVLLFFTRPIAIKKLKIGKVKTNVDSLAGMHAIVTKKISEFERGEINVKGQIWTARCESDSAIEEGTKCEIVRIEGAHAIVRPLETSSVGISEN
jgi:membrane protein implicated in regulation of membrane protease activity